MSINVPPVTGKTPAQIATELRGLIRDRIWTGIKGMDYPTANKKTSQRLHISLNDALIQIDTLHNAIFELKNIAKNRRPSETSKAIDALAENSLFLVRSYITQARTHSNQLGQEQPKAPADLLKYAERAYALVQALPTIDNPSVGKAENTLRAITSIIKVYNGLDVEKTVEHLPDMMAQLLEAIAGGGAVKEPEPDPVMPVDQFVISGEEFKLEPYSFKSAAGTIVKNYGDPGIEIADLPGKEILFLWSDGYCSLDIAEQVFIRMRAYFNHPQHMKMMKGDQLICEADAKSPIIWHNQIEQYEIWSTKKLSTGSIGYSKSSHGFGHKSDPMGDVSDWNGGLCTLEQAKQTLCAVRKRYNDKVFTLRKGGEIIAIASATTPIVWDITPEGVDVDDEDEPSPIAPIVYDETTTY